MYILITITAIQFGLIFGLIFGLVKNESRFKKIQEATFKVYLNAEKKPYEDLMNELLKDIWNAMYK